MLGVLRNAQGDSYEPSWTVMHQIKLSVAYGSVLTQGSSFYTSMYKLLLLGAEYERLQNRRGTWFGTRMVWQLRKRSYATRVHGVLHVWQNCFHNTVATKFQHDFSYFVSWEECCFSTRFYFIVSLLFHLILDTSLWGSASLTFQTLNPEDFACPYMSPTH